MQTLSLSSQTLKLHWNESSWREYWRACLLFTLSILCGLVEICATKHIIQECNTYIEVEYKYSCICLVQRTKMTAATLMECTSSSKSVHRQPRRCSSLAKIMQCVACRKSRCSRVTARSNNHLVVASQQPLMAPRQVLVAYFSTSFVVLFSFVMFASVLQAQGSIMDSLRCCVYCRTQDMAGDPFGLLLRQRIIFLGGEVGRLWLLTR